MANKTYILNKETGHIELHFTKEEYLNLTAEQKQQLKSNFLWSKSADAWVSRSTKDHYFAIKAAKILGFENAGSVGEKLTYAEEIERKVQKAENRIERYEQYAENAEKRAENLQSAVEQYRGDISFWTQPIIRGHAGSESFANYRNKIMDRYMKGFDEYRKSDYFKDKARTSEETANMSKFKDKTYLDNRIKECNSSIKKLEGHVIRYENVIYNKQNNIPCEAVYNERSIEQIQEWLNSTLEKMEYEMDKLAYLENCLDEIGGIKYSKENILPGYLVKIRGIWETVLKANKTTVETKPIEERISMFVLKHPYAEIQELKIPENFETTKKNLETIVNPYSEGEIVVVYGASGSYIIYAYQVLKITDKSITIQEIQLDNNRKPIRDAFIEGSKPERKGIVKSKYSDYVGAYYDNWQLYKYNEGLTA